MGLKSEIAIVTTVRESGSESYREFATSRLGPGSRLAVAARVKFRCFALRFARAFRVSLPRLRNKPATLRRRPGWG